MSTDHRPTHETIKRVQGSGSDLGALFLCAEIMQPSLSLPPHRPPILRAFIDRNKGTKEQRGHPHLEQRGHPHLEGTKGRNKGDTHIWHISTKGTPTFGDRRSANHSLSVLNSTPQTRCIAADKGALPPVLPDRPQPANRDDLAAETGG